MLGSARARAPCRSLCRFVEGVGPGVTAFAPGDAVFGVINPRFTDAYAEYAIALSGMIAKKPAGLDDIVPPPRCRWWQ